MLRLPVFIEVLYVELKLMKNESAGELKFALSIRKLFN